MPKLPWWFMPDLTWRRRIAEWLRWLADKLGPEDAFHLSSLKMRIVENVGYVVDEGPWNGVPLWYRASEFHKAGEGSPT